MSPIERVRAALIDAGIGDVVLELSDSARTAQMAADAIGAHVGGSVPVGAIVKSLVFLIDGQPAIVLGAGDRTIDLKLLGAACQVSRKRVKLADAATALQLTGFEVGGVAPVGHTQKLPVLIDQSLSRFETVWASAGAQHAVFPLRYDQLVQTTSGRVAELTVEIQGEAT